MDSRELTPQLVAKITIAGVKDRSEVEAAKTLEAIGGVKVSVKTVERVLHDVGEEITHLRDCPPSRLSRTLVPKPPADAPQSVIEEMKLQQKRALLGRFGSAAVIHP